MGSWKKNQTARRVRFCFSSKKDFLDEPWMWNCKEGGRKREREREKEFRDWWDNLMTTLYFCTWDRHDLEIMQICRDRLRRWRGTKENSALTLKRCRLVEQNYANLSWNADLYWAVIIVIILHSFTFRGSTWVKKTLSCLFTTFKRPGLEFFFASNFWQIIFPRLDWFRKSW